MTKAKQLLLILLLLLLWIYIGWRTFYTLPTGIALIPGILLLVSEMVLTFQNTLFYILLYKPNSRKTPPLPKDPFTVDILIATYNESTAIVRRTILACKNLEYPQDFVKIWICDDGSRGEMAELARSLKISYITRDHNDHAKAGNLNNALKQTVSELVVTVDADMIPKPQFLNNSLGYFTDEQVAFVQMPQSFYNEDIYQYNLNQNKNIPNEQDLFMRLIQTGRDRFNSTVYIGSNTIFRRTALESIDGFATGTITEDMATGMLIQAKGYKTVFHNEVLAQGLAAESLSDFLSQRIRWARGTIQTMRKWNPVTLKGLTGMQRLLYISSLIYWYFGVFKLIFILAPIVYLIFGIPALKASLTGILIFWLPYFFVSSVVENVFLDKRMKRFWSNIYETSVAPFLAWAVLLETFAKRHIPFKVTPKGITSEKTKINVSFALPHLALLGLSIAAFSMGITRYFEGQTDGIIINMFWLVYNIIIIVPTILLAIERPKFRTAERFKREYQVQIQHPKHGSIRATTIDVSETGCSLLVHSLIEVPEHLELVIFGAHATHHFSGSLVYYDTYKKGYHAGIRFNEMDNADLQQWIKEIYGEIPHESLFQYHPHTGAVPVLAKYYRQFRVPVKKKERTSPRLPIQLPCQVIPLPEDSVLAFEEAAAAGEITIGPVFEMTENSNATICDISLSGCKILVNQANIKHGDMIGIQIYGHTFLGQVVRTVQQKDQLSLGVKWHHDGIGKQLLDSVSQMIVLTE